jgi:hypothetical protein
LPLNGAESRSAPARAEQFALRTASQLAVRRRRVRLAGAAAVLSHEGIVPWWLVRAERWLGLGGLLALAAMLVVGVWHGRVGKERPGEEPPP